MANDLQNIIVSLHPSVSGLGIATGDKVWVLFDREMDEETIKAGNFFITGPDFDTWSGPDLQLFHDFASAGSESEILQSPGYHGIVPGTISFERIDLTTTTQVQTLDTVGSGLLYRTKAIFSPTNRLAANTEYTVHISGDDDTTDDFVIGIAQRTVFDPVASGVNIGTGDLNVVGGYTGSIADNFHIKITTSGEVGTSKFTFWTDSDPLTINGPFKTKYSDILLSDGITVTFDEGLYRVDDTWHFAVKPAYYFSGNYAWPFKTGSGNIVEVPESTSTSVTGESFTSTTVSSSTSTEFSVLTTTPKDEATNQQIVAGEYQIVVKFNDDIDPTTVVSGQTFSVISESVTGEIDSNIALGTLIADATASGQYLTITVASGQLKDNNVVTITLTEDIQSTDGIALSEDYIFWFTTKYNPLYSTSRRLRMEIGSFIQTISDDTINLAIHMASQMANDLTWNSETIETGYYEFVRAQWTSCKAQEILLLNSPSQTGSLRSKKLGDLEVSYDTTNSNRNLALERAIKCMQKLEGALNAGGAAVQKPKYVVKGATDPDRPPVGRGWFRQNTEGGMPAANLKSIFSGQRRFKSIYFTTKKGFWD